MRRGALASGHPLMPQVVTVFGTKGGVGKTTTAVSLAARSADCLRVLLVDLDPQHAGGASHWIRGGDTWRFDHTATRDHNNLCAVTHLRSYDLVIIDTPRADDPLTQTALALSALVICPASPSQAEVAAAVESSRHIPAEIARRVLLTRVDGRAGGALRDAEGALDTNQVPRFAHHIRLRRAHIQAQDHHQPIDLTAGEPATDAAADYRAIAAEVAGLLAHQLARPAA